LSGNLAFGNVTVGQTATTTLTITNNGNSTLTISGSTVPGGGVYTASWTNGTIPAGGSQQVTEFFAPTAAQSYNGTLTVTGDQTSGTNTIAISGTGTPPPLTNWAFGAGRLDLCTGSLCLDFRGSATNIGTGCATNVWFQVEFYTQEFGPFLPDILVFPADSTPTNTLVRPGQTVSFQTGAVFTSNRHITGWLITTHYTPASCQ
jgi:hypothetical protein